jgi:hypothetical protein
MNANPEKGASSGDVSAIPGLSKEERFDATQFLGNLIWIKSGER